MKINNAKKLQWFMSPVRIIVLSFLCVILLGSVLLCLPIASRGEHLSFLSASFTATSATCVTGLTVVDPFTDLTYFGQFVLMCLIEIGGLGTGTLATFFIMIFSRKMGLRSLRLAQVSTASNSLGKIKEILKVTIIISAVIQALGAVILMTYFVPKYKLLGVWISVFTAVSSFCNAGFDVLGMEQKFGSLVNYNGEPVVMITVMALIVLGGLGFIVYYDVLNYKKSKKLSLHTKLVLAISGALIVLGALYFFCAEFSNLSTIGNMTLGEKITASFFQSVSARTAGYASVDMDSLDAGTKVIMVILMLIGGSPSSTAGGLKTTTIAIIAATAMSAIRNRDEELIFNRRIQRQTINNAVSILTLGFVTVFILSWILILTTPGVSRINAVFEASSAFATVGLTAGVTAKMTVFAKICTMFTMFIGRIGPLSFALALSQKQKSTAEKVYPEAKILVG